MLGNSIFAGSDNALRLELELAGRRMGSLVISDFEISVLEMLFEYEIFMFIYVNFGQLWKLTFDYG
jgi:hypothetical protein